MGHARMFIFFALSFLAGACVMMLYHAVHKEQEYTQKMLVASSNEIAQSDKQTGQDELSIKKTKDEMNKEEELPNCKSQAAYRRLKVPQVDSKIWDDVKFVLLFIGYFRSGHSLVGAILDAHPNIVISDEIHVVRTWGTLPKETRTRDRLFEIIYAQSYKQAVAGQRSSQNCHSVLGYKYQVPNQWQGRFDKFIQVIGDKQGPQTVRVLEFQPSGRHVLPQIKQATKIPFKFIHVLRNPFDIVATQILRSLPGRLSSEERERFFKNPYNDSKDEQHPRAKDHARLTSGVVNLIKLYGDDVITIYSEDMIKNPTKELKRLCQLFSVSCSEDYLRDCASIVDGSPSKSRNAILWRDGAKNILIDLIAKTPMLQRYKFNED